MTDQTREFLLEHAQRCYERADTVSAALALHVAQDEPKDFDWMEAELSVHDEGGPLSLYSNFIWGMVVGAKLTGLVAVIAYVMFR